jgi:hypothetical protein
VNQKRECLARCRTRLRLIILDLEQNVGPVTKWLYEGMNALDRMDTEMVCEKAEVAQ